VVSTLSTTSSHDTKYNPNHGSLSSIRQCNDYQNSSLLDMAEVILDYYITSQLWISTPLQKPIMDFYTNSTLAI
jgi:hypothetical protein